MPRVTRASTRLAEAGPSTPAASASRTTRTSRTAAASTSSTPATVSEQAATGATAAVDDQVDADFLALSRRQQRSIDKVFDRALRQGARKRRRGNDGKPVKESATETRAGAEVEEGGFMAQEDEGGFMVDDVDEAGGFLPPSDDEAGGFLPDGGEADGGFLPPSPSPVPVPVDIPGTAVTPASVEPDTPTSIPLSAIPSLLTALNLPYDDDVLAVFRDSATGWSGTEADALSSQKLAVARTDFRAVCAALMEPEAEAEEDVVMSDGIDEEDDEDVYEASRASTPLSSMGGASDDDDFAAEESAAAGGAGKSRKGKGKAKKDLEAPMGIAPKLSREQKDGVKQTWDMFLEISTQNARGPRAVGKDEVRRWAKELGETYTEDEIADMITLFSTQPEKRALSYEDFGNVLVRGGLV